MNTDVVQQPSTVGNNKYAVVVVAKHKTIFNSLAKLDEDLGIKVQKSGYLFVEIFTKIGLNPFNMGRF